MPRGLPDHIRPALRWLVLTSLLGILGAGVTITQWALLSVVIDRIFLRRQGLAEVAGPLGWLVVAAVVRSALLGGREVAAQASAIRVTSQLRARLLAHLFHLGPAFVQGERTGELVGTITEGVDRIDPYVSRYLPQVVLSATVPLMVTAVVLPLDWISGLLLLATAPVIPIMMILVGSYAEEHIQRQWLALSRLSAYLLDVFQGLPTLKLFGRSRAEGERVARVSEAFRARTMKVLRYAFLSGLALEFMTTAAIALIAVALGIRLVSGTIAFQPALLILMLTPEFYRPLRELGVSRHAGMEGKAAAGRIMAILETPAPSGAVDPDAGAPSGALTIEMASVSYRYPGSSDPALDDLTLTLPAGTRTAVVGPSGAGKSTLAQLLLRFLELDSGQILANGVPIGGLRPDLWREHVALVPQRPALFYGTVLENIRLARPAGTRADVMRAATLAGAHDFIARLANGYDTPLGERGARLSHGQRQRIAIARAFLKSAPLLILDEPTSALDPESEEQIRMAVERLVSGRTALIVAHRLTTIFTADQIAVLDCGRQVECGTHADLLARDGLYRRLVGAYREVPA